MSFKLEVDLVVKVSYQAGKEILRIYNSDDFDVETKEDNSPLTKADNTAHKLIVDCLKDTGLPVLSEEGKSVPYSERKSWDLFWMVDPLDGTKEFIKRNGEFTVNIALIKQGKPIFGVVYAPVIDKLFYGGENIGAFLIQNNIRTELKNLQEKHEKIRIVASRSHLNNDTKSFINQYKAHEIVSMGSSLKFMVIAEGKADVYPRFAPTMEWDTAAAHAILKAINIQVLNYITNEELIYNKSNLLNPYFLVNNQ